jgi:hypothetical protein
MRVRSAARADLCQTPAFDQAAGLGPSARNLPAVREESHLDEMRSAIRGDFERLAERRGEQELMRVADADESEREQPPEPEPDHGSWLARLFSSR